MISTKSIVEIVRETLGTPYHHQGRVVGVGIDCVGLLAYVCRTLNLTTYDTTAYPESPPPGCIERHLDAAGFIPLGSVEMRPGEVLTFRRGRPTFARHVAVITSVGEESTMIHCCQSMKRVIEHPIDRKWAKRIVGRYAFPDG